jgi:hypothetical protein
MDTAAVNVQVTPFNDPPAFVFPTPQDSIRLGIVPGHVIEFDVCSSDPDAGALNTITVLGLPDGATMTPDLPFTGNEPCARFHWTKMPGQGDHEYVVRFIATDDSLATGDHGHHRGQDLDAHCSRASTHSR